MHKSHKSLLILLVKNHMENTTPNQQSKPKAFSRRVPNSLESRQREVSKDSLLKK